MLYIIKKSLINNINYMSMKKFVMSIKYLLERFTILFLMFIPTTTFGNFNWNVLIGNFHYLAPNGISFIVEGKAAFVIDPVLGINKHKAVLFDNMGKGFAQAHLYNDYNAGIVAPDDSYHKMLLQLSNNEIVEFEWSKYGNTAVGKLISSNPIDLTFDLSKNWPGFNSEYFLTGNELHGKSLGINNNINWKFITNTEIYNFDGKKFTLKLKGSDSPTIFVAGFGILPTINSVNSIIKESFKKYDLQRPKAISPSGDIIGAMTNNLNNTRIYSNNDSLLFIPVSRSFGIEHANQAPIFCWDSFFNALMATYDNPEMAKATYRAVLSGALPNGMIGNVRHWSMGPSTGNSQPPVGSMCIWRSHLMRPDIDFLREVYPILKSWNEWWMKNRNAQKDSLLQWGDDNGNFEIAMYETGWDDAPHFQGVEGVKMIGSTMNVYAVDLCALWAMDAHYLSLIADAIGEKEAAKKHQQDSDMMNKRINEKLWNDELGIYCSRFFDNEDGTPGKFLTKLSPQNFYPLISGAASKQQAKRVLDLMTDTNLFWGEWILPTISRKEPEFIKQRYWSGNIWGPSNYLTWLGIKRYASDKIKAEYAQKCVRLFMNNWLGAGYCGENYFSINGRVCSNPNYTWGALLCLIGIESVIDILDDGHIVTGCGYNEPIHIENVILKGKPYSLTMEYKTPKIKLVEQ